MSRAYKAGFGGKGTEKGKGEGCWICGKKDHLKKDCPMKPRVNEVGKEESGADKAVEPLDIDLGILEYQECGGDLEVNKVEADKPGWKKAELVMDSGAQETVAGDQFAGNVRVRRDNGQERQFYRTADGTRIPNKGEKRIEWKAEDGTSGKLTVQITDVKKALCSVGKVANAGNRVVFEPHGGYIQNIATGRVTPLIKEGVTYKLQMWVKARDQEDELNEVEHQASMEGQEPSFIWQGIP